MSAAMTEIRRIAALTSAHGVRLSPHAWGSGVLFGASIHVARAAPNCHILEVTSRSMKPGWDPRFESPFLQQAVCLSGERRGCTGKAPHFGGIPRAAGDVRRDA